FLPQTMLSQSSTNGLSDDYLNNTEYGGAVYLGKIKNGLFEGNDLYRIEISEMGMTYYRVIKDEDKIIVLNNYSASTDGYFKGLFSENNKIKIINLEPPLEISIPNFDLKLIKSPDSSEPWLTAKEADLKPLFKFGDWQVYKYSLEGCFIVKAEDGTDRRYYYNFLQPYIETIENAGNKYYSSPAIKGISWNNGSISTDKYSVAKRSCFAGCYNYMDIEQKDLVKAGTFNGQPIYELKNASYKAEDSDQSFLEITYSEFDKTKVSYEEFLKSHPVVFWQDPFGDYITLRNTKFDSFAMAECGKPVIYLYPEKTTDVKVEVAPSGGFTKTEPVYNNGWVVKAEPNGNLYNYANKQIYPYLFWEGKAYNYQMPNSGFVVKKEEVKKFLEEKLAKLGLIKKEYDEFIDFWAPKMQEKPYYFITFVPQEEFDKIAPLSVNPKPDTIIRVFMDFQGLDNFVRVPEQKIVTPERNGFTVVEWGGALHN
ncbi:MAG: hypothetical protein PHU73_04535, partial [Patescibacteria group bacterium]|nr:hypothetical protein [Patescibacteria group bacterium]